MIDKLKPIKIYLKSRNYDTTNWTFKLLCRINVSILFLFSLLMVAREFFGSPIDCGHDNGKVKKESIENFCWVMGMFVHKNFTGVITNNTIAKGYGMVTGLDNSSRIYLRYYQWLVLIYLGMSASFSVPSLLWRYMEGNRVKSICEGLDVALFEKVWTKERRSELLAYFMWPGIRSVHTFYALKYFVCQIILLGVTVFNIWFVDVIFSGFWEKFYPAICALFHYPFNYDTFVTNTAKVFPRMAKCEFYNYGPSGSAQRIDSLCLLPLNIVNEKIFVFLYFWLLLMFIIAFLSIIWSILVSISSRLRICILKAQSRQVTFDEIRRATHNGALGDFFILHLLGKNMNAYVFKDLLAELGNYKQGNCPDKVETKEEP